MFSYLSTNTLAVCDFAIVIFPSRTTPESAVVSPPPVRDVQRQASQLKSSRRHVPLSCYAWRWTSLTGGDTTLVNILWLESRGKRGWHDIDVTPQHPPRRGQKFF